MNSKYNLINYDEKLRKPTNVTLTIIFLMVLLISGCDENIKPDTTPPIVTITSPQNGSTVSEIVTITCITTDNEGIKKVELWVDADSISINDYDEPYILEWNTATYTNTSHLITIRSYDTSDNWADSEPISLIVDNSNSYPTPSELYPIKYENGSFVITWSQNNDDDFQSYTLYESFSEDMNNETAIFSTNENTETSYVAESVSEIRYFRLNTEDIFGLKSTSNMQSGLPFIIHVPVDQFTIQAGINVATNGDTILVQSGNYIENINFNGKLITVASLFLTTQDTSYISQTIIDGNQSGLVAYFNHDEDYTATLMGFTVSNGEGGIRCQNSSPSLINLIIINNESGDGGGISCWDNSNPIIKNVCISNNLAYDLGGGICLFNSNPLLKNVIINNNHGYEGGGIYCHNSSPILENVLIVNNYGYLGGGFCCSYSAPILVNATIAGNQAEFGGGLYCYGYSDPTLLNTIISNNNGEYGISCTSNSNPTIEYCDVYDNEIGNFNNCNPGIGCIELDPLFVNFVNENYHLLPNSPCINVGNPDQQYNDPDGSRNDMGAYGGPNGVW